MQFTSFFYLLFLFIFFIFWPFTKNRVQLRWGYIVLASLIFYGWASWKFVLVLLAIGLISFFVGLLLEKYPEQKRAVLILALLGIVSPLVVFKYSRFFLENADALLSLLNGNIRIAAQFPSFAKVLPVGISFYSFQALSYVLDIYHQRLTPAKNILHFFAYLFLFPKLIAGPIERGRALLPQLATARDTDEQQRWDGLKLIVSGYFLKAVIADNLAPAVNAAFGAATFNHSSLYWWSIITAFAFQVYCDFNGYSNIALGLAKWMGINLTNNFNFPYRSASVGEFWTRWHISLSNWLRDYIFYPLGRSKFGKGHPHINMWITMLISGLWHGAAWTFILWGALHALYISLERLTHWPARWINKKAVRGFAVFLVIIQLWIAWVFFRAENIPQAFLILQTMFSFSGSLTLGFGFSTGIFLIVAILREIFYPLRWSIFKKSASPWAKGLEVAIFAVLIVSSVYLRGPGNEFFYFQF